MSEVRSFLMEEVRAGRMSTNSAREILNMREGAMYDAKMEKLKIDLEHLRNLRRAERMMWVAATLTAIAAVLSITALTLKYI